MMLIDPETRCRLLALALRFQLDIRQSRQQPRPCWWRNLGNTTGEAGN